jgi:flagellar biosynthesis anti-sigma factor FlgM
MQGPEFRNSIPSDIASSKITEQQRILHNRPSERQQRITELKQQIQSGVYQVDTRRLAEKILSSGVLRSE